jgi:hypothetical protein
MAGAGAGSGVLERTGASRKKEEEEEEEVDSLAVFRGVPVGASMLRIVREGERGQLVRRGAVV